jgi:hypothetical protein
VVWRRSQPAEPQISHEEVLDIIGALADIKALTVEIHAYLFGDDEGEGNT